MAPNNGAGNDAPKHGEEWQHTALLIVDMQVCGGNLNFTCGVVICPIFTPNMRNTL